MLKRQNLGAQPSALWHLRGVRWHGRWEGDSGRREHVYTCGWFMLIYGRGQHNIVKQLSSNKKYRFKKKRKFCEKQTKKADSVKHNKTRYACVDFHLTTTISSPPAGSALSFRSFEMLSSPGLCLRPSPVCLMSVYKVSHTPAAWIVLDLLTPGHIPLAPTFNVDSRPVCPSASWTSPHRHPKRSSCSPWPELRSIDLIFIVCLVTQSCPTLCNPMDCSPPGSSVHGDSPGKNTGVGCHALLQGIFPTQGLNPALPHYRQIFLPSVPAGEPPFSLGVSVFQNCISSYPVA